MSRAAAKKPKGPFDPTLERVRRGERVVLRRGRKAVAAVVPLKDLRLLEEIEDRLDAELAKKALAEPGRIEYREFFRKLGL
jgi:antitoxin (DNA-binding transcriptional repressor) of toxin-antitoxin stability system